MQLPKSFKLLNHTIKIENGNKLLDSKKYLGEADYTKNRILVCDELDGNPLPDSVVQHTTYHEIVHMMLNAMGEYKLNKNEQFVDLMGGLLCQVINTMKFKDK